MPYTFISLGWASRLRDFGEKASPSCAEHDKLTMMAHDLRFRLTEQPSTRRLWSANEKKFNRWTKLN